ncbi:HdeD family acid-resistance protein [Gallaecimonas xiamenensis]|uniref:Acid-resistance membrane protein n=1 Tax=Gallaecimonas xiamenensis 3-C-1 TaxID=745411 RepID=K2JR63_9GAMM|nr:DUF308 domain-containing protein [Gallaecimonas xiamenensis]EKE77838.1 hypothetical protein B3C1_00220 [Gallaecimonas xiamenensis 3-C-1]
MLPMTPFFQQLQLSWRWLLGLGLVFMVLGAIGLGMANFLTLTSMIYFGVLLLIGGLLQTVQALRSRPMSGLVAGVGVLYGLLGFYLIVSPMAAASALTLLIAFGIGFVALLRLWLAFHLRQFSQYIWPFVSGLLGLVLAILIIGGWPESGLWVIGTFIAIELLLNGLALVSIALAVKERS